jgi:hypothetical protein
MYSRKIRGGCLFYARSAVLKILRGCEKATGYDSYVLGYEIIPLKPLIHIQQLSRQTPLISSLLHATASFSSL